MNNLAEVICWSRDAVATQFNNNITVSVTTITITWRMNEQQKRAEVICWSRDAVCNSIRQEIAASHRRLILTDVNLQIFKSSKICSNIMAITITSPQNTQRCESSCILLLKYNGNNNGIVALYSELWILNEDPSDIWAKPSLSLPSFEIHCVPKCQNKSTMVMFWWRWFLFPT